MHFDRLFIAPLRKYLRFFLIFFVLTPLIFVVRMLVWPTAWVSERADRRLRRELIRLWAYGFAAIAGIRIRVHGTPPPHPFYLVANHLSYLDMLLLCRETGCIFVARGDVEHWPVLGSMAKSLYIIFIDRASKRDTMRVNTLIKHALEMGDGLGVFAESRISRGLAVEPFKSSLIQPAVDNQMPVYYATLSYETAPGCPPASEIVGWWRPEPFFFHMLRLFSYPGCTATLHFGAEPIGGDDRKVLAQQLHDAVEETFTPLQ